jgi:microcystin-dependent protein
MTTFKSGPEVITSTTRPGNPAVGETIYETDTASYRWWTGSAWEGLIPVGTVEPFAGSTAPIGWLLCYGQAVSRTTYADLFLSIKEIYGGGDGSTTFNVPDLRGRGIHGKDDMSGTAASRLTTDGGVGGSSLGSSGGDQYIHPHTHTYSTSGTSGNDSPDHAHQWTLASAGNAQGTGDLPFRGYNGWDGGFRSFGSTGFGYGAGWQRHAHSFSWSGTTADHNLTAGATHNMPPTLILHYIIKY